MANRSFVAVFVFLAALGVAGCASPNTSPSADRSVTRAAASSAPASPTPGEADDTHPTPTPSAGNSPRSGAGIRGVTVVDGCPVMTDPPCADKPISARLSILDAGGSVLATVDSGPDGGFTITIGPGQYVLRPASASGGLPRPPDPFAVTVQPDAYTTVTVRFDSGMR
jgi:hypothetical protein